SRRRHTRSKRDWSSDVCSSDLFLLPVRRFTDLLPWGAGTPSISSSYTATSNHFQVGRGAPREGTPRMVGSEGRATGIADARHRRSEERRVGKEGGARRGAGGDS